jgi:hypothetical protein
MNVAFQRNIGSFIRAANGLAAGSVTAGGAGDNSAFTGLTVDRNQFEQLLLSGALVVPITAALGMGETAAASCEFEDSADGTNWDPYLDAGPPDNVVETLGSDGAQCVVFKCQLGGARRYIRAKPKFDMSASGTDTITIAGGVWIFGGADELPITSAVAEALSS